MTQSLLTDSCIFLAASHDRIFIFRSKRLECAQQLSRMHPIKQWPQLLRHWSLIGMWWILHHLLRAEHALPADAVSPSSRTAVWYRLGLAAYLCTALTSLFYFWSITQETNYHILLWDWLLLIWIICRLQV